MKKDKSKQTVFNIINDADNYVRIHNKTISDKRLSWKARGILAFLLSRPKTWQTYMSEVVKHSTDGKDSLYSGIKELEKYGYIVKCRKYNHEKKRIDGIDYFVYGKPHQQPEYQHAGKQHLGNPPLLKTNRIKKNNKNMGDKNRHLIDTTTFDEKLAIRLKIAIDNKGKLNRTSKQSTWERELTNIRIKNKYTKKHMKTIVLWYIKNIDKKYTPQIYKIKDLSDKFKRIKDAMKRQADDITDTENIKVSKQAITIAENLFELNGWPGDYGIMENIVQLSINNHKLFRKKHKKVLQELKTKRDNKSKQLLQFVRHIDTDELLDCSWFIEHDWFMELYPMLKNRPNANLFNYVFSIEQKHFDKLGCKWANDFTGSSKVWTAYKKAIMAI